MNIFPSILVDTYEEFERKIYLVEHEAKFFHVDVGDGIFVPHKSFQNVEKIGIFAWKNPFELHLMLAHPETSVIPWLKTSAKRIIFHWEAQEGAHTWVWPLIRRIKAAGKEAGIAINPKTSQEKIYAFLRGIDLVVIMSVEPGFSSQAFMPEVIPKIQSLREKKFSGIIEVDGGMNEQTIPLVKEAGADAVAVASAIFESENPKEALRKLKAQNEKRKMTVQNVKQL